MSKPTTRPNILIMAADQLRASALSCYGNRVCQTPNLDRLAKSGVVFSRAFTPDPICVPARASITTGNYPHKATGIKDNVGMIRPGQPKLAEHFARHGYETYACGKLHYVPNNPPGEPRVVHGFQHWDSTVEGIMPLQFDPKGQQRGLEDYLDYLADVGWGGYSRAHGVGNNDFRPCPWPLPAEHHIEHWIADRTIDRIREHTQSRPDQPFLAWCGFVRPHPPIDPPIQYAHMYDPRQVDPPVGDESLLSDRDPFIDELRLSLSLNTLSPQARRVIKAYYYSAISFQDAQIGRIMGLLDELNLRQNTIILFTADHGDLLGDFGTFHKGVMLRGSIEVPLIWSGPGVPGGEYRDQLVGLQDILPTLAEMAHCPLENEVHGLSLVPALADSRTSVRDLYYAQCMDSPQQTAMVTDGHWKYCYAQRGPTEELYDLDHDPTELVNLANKADYAQQVARWRAALREQARTLGDVKILDESSPTGLVRGPLDRTKIGTERVAGMGWRWF